MAELHVSVCTHSYINIHTSFAQVNPLNVGTGLRAAVELKIPLVGKQERGEVGHDLVRAIMAKSAVSSDLACLGIRHLCRVASQHPSELPLRWLAPSAPPHRKEDFRKICQRLRLQARICSPYTHTHIVVLGC